MRRGRWLTGVAVLLAVAVAAAAGPAAAADEPRREFGILFGAGVLDPGWSGVAATASNAGPVVGGRFAYVFPPRLAVFADVTFGRYDTAAGMETAEALSARVGPELLLPWITPRSRLFLSASLGWLRGQGGDAVDFDRGMGSVGFGQRIVTRSSDVLRWEARAERAVGGEGSEGGGLTNYQLLLGWSFGHAHPDSDGDGVRDPSDRCPATYQGWPVDRFGCPSDSDGDGVVDPRDRCPGTPSGYPVDEHGCPLDSDADGVADGADGCPGTPRAVAVDARGCPLDSDGDGVPDGSDACPGTAQGVVVDGRGCPLDSDGDGVPDASDTCAGTPAGVKVDGKGCPPPKPTPPAAPPKPAPVTEPVRGTLVLDGVTFATDDATLTPASKAALARVAASLLEWREVRVEVAGHTDATGGAEHNQELSRRRAAAVADYLVQTGVEIGRLTVRGYGASRPVAGNGTREGRAANRRVELTRTN